MREGILAPFYTWKRLKRFSLILLRAQPAPVLNLPSLLHSFCPNSMSTSHRPHIPLMTSVLCSVKLCSLTEFCSVHNTSQSAQLVSLHFHIAGLPCFLLYCWFLEPAFNPLSRLSLSSRLPCKVSPCISHTCSHCMSCSSLNSCPASTTLSAHIPIFSYPTQSCIFRCQPRAIARGPHTTPGASNQCTTRLQLMQETLQGKLNFITNSFF